MFKNVISTCYLLFATIFIMNAQGVEVGFFVGSSGYMGDVQSTHLEKAEISLATGVIGCRRHRGHLGGNSIGSGRPLAHEIGRGEH